MGRATAAYTHTKNEERVCRDLVKDTKLKKINSINRFFPLLFVVFSHEIASHAIQCSKYNRDKWLFLLPFYKCNAVSKCWSTSTLFKVSMFACIPLFRDPHNYYRSFDEIEIGNQPPVPFNIHTSWMTEMGGRCDDNNIVNDSTWHSLTHLRLVLRYFWARLINLVYVWLWKTMCAHTVLVYYNCIVSYQGIYHFQMYYCPEQMVKIGAFRVFHTYARITRDKNSSLAFRMVMRWET